MHRVWHGDHAVEMVELLEGEDLTYEKERVVRLEGYVLGTYYDTKGILTGGVGQTGKWLNRSFSDSFEHHVKRAEYRVPGLRKLPEFLRAELIQAEYRGDLGMSPKTCRYIRAGHWEAAAEEFLDHAEYKSRRTPVQIKRRIEAVSHALALHGSMQ